MPWMLRPRVGPFVYRRRTCRKAVRIPAPLFAVELILACYLVLPWIPVTAVLVVVLTWFGLTVYLIRRSLR